MTKTRTRTTMSRLTMATLSGRRWDGGRNGSGSRTRARQRPKMRRPGFPMSVILTGGMTTTTKRRTMTTAPDLTTILLPLPPLSPPPACNHRSCGCIPLPTMTRTIMARNGNTTLLLVTRVLNSATTMWTPVRTRILRRQTGGGGVPRW